ncbi:hypothetical protein HHK36_016549 [Tetracentron sinense]|uniref:PWWP domain-containing protein n=1 Tax=Tetracentron sinense TaxID=13715 RepID=A0A834YXF6_TETSI|nr:hypothetical protein HHK36_016549 [Tetracentron sinense]
MSANPSVPDDIDLNSDAVFIEEQNEGFGVNDTESTVIVSVSETETLTEPSPGQRQVEGVVSEGVIDEVRVCSGGEDSVDALVQDSDVRVYGSGGRGAEGDLNEDVAEAGSVEGLERLTESVDRVGDEKEDDVLMLQEVRVLEDVDGKTGTEVAKKVDCSKKITEFSVERTQVVFVGGGGVAVMNNDEVSNPKDEVSRADALDEIFCSETNQSLEVEMVGGSTEENSVVGADPHEGFESPQAGVLNTSFPVEAIPYQGASNSVAEVTDGSHVSVACASPHKEGEPDFSQVAETLHNIADGDQSMDSIPVEVIAKQGGFVTASSNSVAGVVIDGFQASVDCAFPCGEGGPDFCRVSETLLNKVDGIQRMDSHPIEVIPNQGAEVTCGSQASVAGSSPHGEGEPVFSLITESASHLLDENPGAEDKVTCASLPHEDHNMGTHVSELVTHGENQTMEVEMQAEGGFCEINGNKIMEVQVSEISPCSGIGSYMSNLVTALDTCPSPDANLQSVDEVVNKDISPAYESHSKGVEINQMEIDMGFAESGHLDEKEEHDVTQFGSNENQEMGIEEQATNIGLSKIIEKKTVKRAALKHERSMKEYRASYCLPTEKEGEFSVSDLVWGKVRSHPWWPAQIFDPLDSSEQAMKYRKKNSFLVAYFGDQTFAWNEAPLLKPFHNHFSLMEKQSNLEAFHNAVDCALDEVSRRVELGLACSCMSEEAYAKIKSQLIENAGIQEESSRRDGVEKSTSMTSFEPDKLVDFIKALAQFPSGGGDRLELVIAKAQLLAFYRSKGYCCLPEFQFCGGLLENDADTPLPGDKNYSHKLIEHATPAYEDEEQVSSGKGKSKGRGSSSRKRKHILEDTAYPRKKERSLSELMVGKKASAYSINGGNESDEKTAHKSVSSSGKKRKVIDSLSKVVDSFPDDLVPQNRKKSFLSPRAADTMSRYPEQSCKVGERIRRVASQLTGSHPILKSSGERFQESAVKVRGSRKKTTGVGFGVSLDTPEESQRRRMVIPTDYSSPDEMLSQLCLAARDPMKGYSFLTIIVSFFSDFRNSINLDQSSSGKQKKPLKKMGGGKNNQSSKSDDGSPETYAFEDMKDSYWTDRIIQSSPEEQPSKNRNRKGEFQMDTSAEKDMPTVEPETSLQLSPKLDSEQSSDGHPELFPEKPVGCVDEKCEEEFSPTALILNFNEIDSVPSETNLNKIFSRFGPLKESQTEVLRKTSRARVVFKRQADAEAAFSSAGKFSIFGPALVSYRLRSKRLSKGCRYGGFALLETRQGSLMGQQLHEWTIPQKYIYRPLGIQSYSVGSFSLLEYTINFYMMGKSKADEKILSYNDVVLRQSDVEILSGPYFLNDRIIEFYFSYLASSCPSKDILLVPPSISFWVANCPDFESLKDFVGPLILSDKKLVIFAINNNDDVTQAEGGTHWSLLAYERNANVFVHHDSIAGSNKWHAKRLYKAVAGFMDTSNSAPNVKYVECTSMPQQMNGYDCGLYVTATAKVICRWHESGGSKSKADLWSSALKEQVSPSAVSEMRNEIRGLITDFMAKQCRCPDVRNCSASSKDWFRCPDVRNCSASSKDFGYKL